MDKVFWECCDVSFVKIETDYIPIFDGSFDIVVKQHDGTTHRFHATGGNGGSYGVDLEKVGA